MPVLHISQLICFCQLSSLPNKYTLSCYKFCFFTITNPMTSQMQNYDKSRHKNKQTRHNKWAHHWHGVGLLPTRLRNWRSTPKLDFNLLSLTRLAESLYLETIPHFFLEHATCCPTYFSPGTWQAEMLHRNTGQHRVIFFIRSDSY